MFWFVSYVIGNWNNWHICIIIPFSSYNSLQISKANEMIDELELWNKAVASERYEDYCNYYVDYPDGLFAEKAIEKIQQKETADWKAALTNNSIKAYEDFVKKYPIGYYASNVQSLITELRLAPFLNTPPSFNDITAFGPYPHPGYSLVCLGNVDKQNTIRISFTGPTGFTKSFKAGSFEWIRVKNGNYKILVQASDTENWWGKALFENRVYADA